MERKRNDGIFPVEGLLAHPVIALRFIPAFILTTSAAA